MSVLVTIWMRGDAKKFEQIAVDDPNRMRSIADRGREHGAIAHRFYATDDGDVMVPSTNGLTPRASTASSRACSPRSAR